MKRKDRMQKNLNQPLNEDNLKNVAGGLTAEDVRNLYDAGYELRVHNDYKPNNTPTKTFYSWFDPNHKSASGGNAWLDMAQAENLAKLLKNNP